MLKIVKYIIAITMVMVVVSCGNPVEPNKGKKSATAGPPLRRELIEAMISQKEHEVPKSEKEKTPIDFFGVRLQGTYDDIVSEMYELPVLSLMERKDSISEKGNGNYYFCHIAKFCGVPCGMNVHFCRNKNNEMMVYNITFITSMTDNYIIDSWARELKKYYGTPNVSNRVECTYRWFLPDRLHICARHLHVLEGGWTVYFSSE